MSYGESAASLPPMVICNLLALTLLVTKIKNRPRDSTNKIRQRNTMRTSTQTILVAVFAALASTSAYVERHLIDGQPCLSLATIPFPNSVDKNCTRVDVMAAIATELTKVSCPHNARQEALLLTGSSDLGEAKYILNQICKGKSYKACTSWDNIKINGCDFAKVMAQVETLVAAAGSACTHDATTELTFLTGTKVLPQARNYVEIMCADAWSTVTHTEFANVDARFNDAFMSEYYDGKTFLNSETGNFQGADNPSFPVSAESKSAGESIKAFYDTGAKTTVLNTAIPDLQCKGQAMMCCFGRDRQSNDNNGDCADGDCADKGPADNSNLCFTDFPTVVPYPLESEGTIHCHGVAWGSDINGFEAQLRYNNLFYVSLYDHMYQRGYVEKTVPNDYVPMCGCIEDMPPVSRADCTEVETTLTVTLSRDGDGFLDAVADNDLNVRFNQCKGTVFGTTTAANNDLASYTNVLVRDGKMTPRVQREIFNTLVGFKTPGGQCERGEMQAGIQRSYWTCLSNQVNGPRSSQNTDTTTAM
jgi:hypothetical protein